MRCCFSTPALFVYFVHMYVSAAVVSGLLCVHMFVSAVCRFFVFSWPGLCVRRMAPAPARHV